ncbi:hypothetical protein, partial [Klebsiella pneumoniae]|uniref:hypothetical protein n=1 Tax=Klebsiella pneumoniae TaxID=573 RepID=UPI003D677A2F
MIRCWDGGVWGVIRTVVVGTRGMTGGPVGVGKSITVSGSKRSTEVRTAHSTWRPSASVFST